MTSPPLPRQFIAFPGLYNLRTLSGYQTLDGDLVADGVLFRSESFFRLSKPQHHELVAELNLHTVIDLRSENERSDYGVLEPLPGLKVVSIPLPDLSLDRALAWDDPDYLLRAYHRMVDDNAAQIGAVLTSVLDPNSWPTLFHCAAGKDRTGIVAILALALAGVGDDEIVADYSLTDLAFERILADRITDPGVDRVDWASFPPAVLAASPETARSLLAHIRHRYGTVTDYILSIGIPEALLVRYRLALLKNERALR
ncbi:MAG: tyrosine-protein phosphatase [Ferrimicrobium sp.]